MKDYAILIRVMKKVMKAVEDETNTRCAYSIMISEHTPSSVFIAITFSKFDYFIHADVTEYVYNVNIKTSVLFTAIEKLGEDAMVKDLTYELVTLSAIKYCELFLK